MEETQTGKMEWPIKDELTNMIYKIQCTDSQDVVIKFDLNEKLQKYHKVVEIQNYKGYCLGRRNLGVNGELTVETLTELYNDIQNQDLLKKSCFNRVKCIVKSGLYCTYPVEMDMWRNGEDVYLCFKKEGEYCPEFNYRKKIALDFEIIFSARISWKKETKELDAIAEKIKKELEISSSGSFFNDQYRRYYYE